MRKVIKNKERFKIFNSNQMIAKLNKIYEEIKDYDSHFWSNFMAIIWTFCSACVSLTIFMLSFSENNFYIKLVLYYAVVFFTMIILLIIKMCGSVNYEAKVTYKLLSSYKLVCIQTKQSVVSMTWA